MTRYTRRLSASAIAGLAVLIMIVGGAQAAAANPPHPGPVTSGAAVEGASPSSAWVCTTTAYQPYKSGSGGPGAVIHAGMDLNCNVIVTGIWFYVCVQVSNNNSTWWDQQGTCGWRVGGPSQGQVSYAEADWTCIGNNGWYYRTRGYSEKTFPNGVVSNSPMKYSPSIFENC